MADKNLFAVAGITIGVLSAGAFMCEMYIISAFFALVSITAIVTAIRTKNW